MTGYQVSFYTTLSRRVHGRLARDWLVDLARELGIQGATVLAGVEGYGHHGRIHAAHFFELADEPIVLIMVVSEEHKDLLFSRLRAAACNFFYTVQAVEFGMTGGPATG
ncbi:MAG: DUF190 domain-containing protein [Proteobacteria bacterium]|nr:DUF190 domain-containing protein [Pseudomonadota bacterium]